MTNKEVIWETIQFIKNESRKHSTPNMLHTIWKDFEAEKQDYFRELMAGLINLNTNQWEFQLTMDGILAHEDDFDNYGNFVKYEAVKPKIVTSYLEDKFLKYIKAKEKPYSKEVNLTEFMISNFDRPDPKSSKTTNENDEGVNFLMNLRYRKFIDYNPEDLAHVNYWYADHPKDTIKCWFDTLHIPMKVWLTNQLHPSFPNAQPKANIENKAALSKSLFKPGYDCQAYLNILKRTTPQILNELGEYILGERRKSYITTFFDLLLRKGVINYLSPSERASQINSLIPNLNITSRTLQNASLKLNDIETQYSALIEKI